MMARFTCVFGRPKWPNFTAEGQKFELGKAQVLAEGTDVSIIACGHMVWIAVEAAKMLAEQGISVGAGKYAYYQALDEAGHHNIAAQNRLRGNC